MKTPARVSAAIDASNMWALRNVRAAIHASLAGRDLGLPKLADRRWLTLPGATEPLQGRLYRPEGVAADAPLLLYFHGGGFVVNDLDTHEAFCIRVAAAAGMRVLAAQYRLAPEYRYPAQLDDALAVTRWVVGDGAAEFDLGRGLAIGGDSAGAYLAASVAAVVHAERPGAIKAQLLIYPFLQMENGLWAESMLKETRIVGWAAVQYINAQLAQAGDIPPSLLTAGQFAPLPSIITAGGALDPCRADALVLVDALRAAGRPVVWRDYPALAHGFINLTHNSGAACKAVAEMGELLGEAMRR